MKREERMELWGAVLEYVESLRGKIPFALLVSHGYSINDRKEWEELKRKFKVGNMKKCQSKQI